MGRRRTIKGIFTTIRPTSPIASSYAGFPEDMDDWSCSQWMAYWNRNKKALGVDKARELFLIDLDNIGSFADVNSCKYDCSFVNFFAKEGFSDIGNIFSKAWCAGNNAVDTVSTAVTAVGNVADSVSNTGKTLKTLTQPVVLIPLLAIAGLIYYEYKKPKSKRRGRR